MMKQCSFALTIVFLLLGHSANAQPDLSIVGCDELACDGFVEENMGSTTWWVSADAQFLRRSQNNHSIIVIDENNSQAPVLTGNDLAFGVATGPRIAMGWAKDANYVAELVYFGMNDWATRESRVGNNNLSIPGDLGLATFDFFAADRMDVSYGSRIHNVEANVWSPIANAEWLVGFRHFSVNEQLQIASFDSDTFNSDYQIHADNHLFGGQVGVRKRWTQERLSFAPEAKFGIFGNSNDQHSLVRDLDNTTVLRDVREDSSTLSSLTELRLVGNAAITGNLHATFGYNLIWVTGLAQAPNQLDFSFTSSSSRFVDDSHSVFYHGAIVGLNWIW